MILMCPSHQTEKKTFWAFLFVLKYQSLFRIETDFIFNFLVQKFFDFVFH